MSIWHKLLLIALLGAFGALTRFGLAVTIQRRFDSEFPWGTMAVNMLGCLLFGLVWGLYSERAAISEQTRAIVLVGFLGSFTTFSTFVHESVELLRESQWLYFVANFAGQNILGVMALVFGLYLSRIL